MYIVHTSAFLGVISKIKGLLLAEFAGTELPNGKSFESDYEKYLI